MPQFCLPDGVVEVEAGSPQAAHLEPLFFSFALTDGDGSRSFASCALFYEPRACKPCAWPNGRRATPMVCIARSVLGPHECWCGV